MNDEPRTDSVDAPEPLEAPLSAAVQAALAEPIPDDAVARVASRAKQLATAAVAAVPSAADAQRRGWRPARPFVAALAAAAAILIVLAGGFLWWNPFGGGGTQGNPAFAEMVERVKAAGTVRVAMVARFGQQPEQRMTTYAEGNRSRTEHDGGLLTVVADFGRKQMLYLDASRKQFQKLEMSESIIREYRKLYRDCPSPVDVLRRAKSADAEPIGEEFLQGRRTQVYRVRHFAGSMGFPEGWEGMVWVDAQTSLPSKIVIRDPDPKSPMEVRLEDFVWNEPLDARLFSLAAPAGYEETSVIMTPEQTKPSPQPAVALDNPNYPTDGVLCPDRVPAHIVWGPQGKSIIALLRDPESTPVMEHQENELRQWDAATGKLGWWARIRGAGWLAATRDGKTLATVIGYEMQLRDASTGQVTRKWATDEHVSPLAFSPDGKTLAAGITEWGPYGGKGGKPSGGVQFWDVERASLVRQIRDDKPTTWIGYSIDGKRVASSSNDGPVKLWDAATGSLVRVIPARGPAAFSPDGKSIACPSVAPGGDKTAGRVQLYDLANGSLLKSFASEKGASSSYLLCVRFYPDGRLLAATDWNRTVTLWDVATTARKQSLTGHQAGALSAAFSPDGARLATGSEDKTLRVRKVPAAP